MNEKIVDYKTKEECKEGSTLLGSVNLKAPSAEIIVFCVGAACLFFRNLFGFLFGGFCILLAVLVHFKAKDHHVMDVYEDAIVFFEHDAPENGLRIPLSDVSQWEVNRNQNYGLTIMTNDGSRYESMTYQVNKAARLLRKVLPGRSTEDIAIKNSKNKRGKRKWKLR